MKRKKITKKEALAEVIRLLIKFNVIRGSAVVHEDRIVVNGDVVFDNKIFNVEQCFTQYSDILKKYIVDNNIQTQIGVLPPFVTFESISGSMYCSFCGLKSLTGFPSFVGNNLYLNANRLDNTSLTDFPKYVEGNVTLCNNQITQMSHSQCIINGSLSLENNPIISLIGIPKVYGDIDVDISLTGHNNHVFNEPNLVSCKSLNINNR